MSQEKKHSKVEDAVVKYFSWLQEGSLVCEADGGWWQVTTQFLDGHNDRIQIYVKQTPGGWLLCDDGQTFDSVGSRDAWDAHGTWIDRVLRGLGVAWRENSGTYELHVSATDEDFPLRFHNILQAVIVIGNI